MNLNRHYTVDVVWDVLTEKGVQMQNVIREVRQTIFTNFDTDYPAFM